MSIDFSPPPGFLDETDFSKLTFPVEGQGNASSPGLTGGLATPGEKGKLILALGVAAVALVILAQPSGRRR